LGFDFFCKDTIFFCIVHFFVATKKQTQKDAMRQNVRAKKRGLLGFERTKNGLDTEMARTRSVHRCDIQWIARVVFSYNTTKCHSQHCISTGHSHIFFAVFR